MQSSLSEEPTVFSAVAADIQDCLSLNKRDEIQDLFYIFKCISLKVLKAVTLIDKNTSSRNYLATNKQTT